MLRLLEMRFMEMMGGISLKVIRSRFYLTPFLKNKKMKGPSKWTKYYSSWTTTSCRWLPKLSFLPEYGPKLKEDYVMVKHLPKILKDDDDLRKCCACCWFSCCNDNWQKVWAVLKPGFLALLEDPFHTQPLDITVFDVLPASDGNGEGRVSLAKEIKERNPLRHAFKVTCGIWSVRIRGKNGGKVKDWVAAINDAGLRPPDGWCHPLFLFDIAGR
ncbi:phospholipase D zeta 1-like isoform X2 [Castanea sativa]|uniref:phospholipase D zeta 1-like isoform X2 n=1 Tax=Castanea sativa TaxID=21020 RepID=UPI003F64D306